MSGIKIVGIKELEKQLRRNMTLQDVKDTVKLNASELNDRMQRKTAEVFVKGYSVPNLVKTIKTEIRDNGFTAEVGATAEYGAYVEAGTRFMGAEPYCEPSLREQEKIFKSDMQKLVK